jgi:hypothetical protein
MNLAEGPTKKQAKHLASKYMLEKLEQLDKAHAEVMYGVQRFGWYLIKKNIPDSWKHHRTVAGYAADDWYRERDYKRGACFANTAKLGTHGNVWKYKPNSSQCPAWSAFLPCKNTVQNLNLFTKNIFFYTGRF